MMTTLRSDRRTRRNATFNLEYLDDRIVLSAASAATHVAAAVSASHARAAEKAAVALERHDAKLAKVEARAAAKVAQFERAHPGPSAPVSPSPTPVRIGGTETPYSSSPVTSDLAVASTATSSSTPTNASQLASTTVTPAVTTSTPAATTVTPAVTTSTQAATTSTTSSTISSTPLPANASVPLQSLYAQYASYESSGASGTFTPTGMNGFQISGTDVGINFQTNDSADFNALLTQLQSDGLQVTTDSATYGIIDGMVPIAQLPAVAQLSSTASVTALSQPIMH